MHIQHMPSKSPEIWSLGDKPEHGSEKLTASPSPASEANAQEACTSPLQAGLQVQAAQQSEAQPCQGPAQEQGHQSGAEQHAAPQQGMSELERLAAYEQELEGLYACSCAPPHGLPAIAEGSELFRISVSFGSVNSTISIPLRMSHASVPLDLRAARSLPEDLLRLSIGIEDSEDLIADLGRKLEAI